MAEHMEGTNKAGTLYVAPSRVPGPAQLPSASTSRMQPWIFAMPHARRSHLVRFVELASRNFRNVTVMPDLAGATTSAVMARDLAGTFGVEIKHNLLDSWALRAKRTLELALTVVGDFDLSVLRVLCLLVYLESRGHVFYKD